MTAILAVVSKDEEYVNSYDEENENIQKSSQTKLMDKVIYYLVLSLGKIFSYREILSNKKDIKEIVGKFWNI